MGLLKKLRALDNTFAGPELDDHIQRINQKAREEAREKINQKAREEACEIIDASEQITDEILKSKLKDLGGADELIRRIERVGQGTVTFDDLFDFIRDPPSEGEYSMQAALFVTARLHCPGKGASWGPTPSTSSVQAPTLHSFS